jgi:hypothetical protein
MSQNLKWYFETTKNTFSGANDPIHETFRAHRYYSLVRESIQNSLDVRLDKSKPVLVKFETITINQVEHPELFSIRKHIEGCLDFHKGNKQAEDLYSSMLKYLDENQAVKILKVSDYNTEGMNYKSHDHLCPFTSFMGEGISSKSSGSGGSFGFGKGAYYVPSELRTILVSTQVEDGKVFFQGRTRLASHTVEGITKGKDGVFKIDEDDPVTEVSNISPIFRRTERGTDVFIIGMNEDPYCGKEMIRSVLNNFWLAVHEDRLDVIIKTDDVGEVRFDETNLEEIMDEYFPEEVEYGPISSIYSWNPKAYYKAVKYKEASKDFLYFEKELDSVGSVRLYVYRKEGLQNRVSFMRKPAMTVYKIGRSVLSGYAAVFVCDNKEGNEILRQMENAAHNEWKPENVRYVPKEEMQVYYDAKKEINDFVMETLTSISGVDNSSRMDVAGLADFLTIPEELLDNEEPVSGNAKSSTVGDSTDTVSEEETGLTITTNTIIKPKIRRPMYSEVSGSAQQGDGDDVVNVGGGEDNDSDNPIPNPSPTSGDQIDTGSADELGDSNTPIPVQFRIAAQSENGEVVHNLILHSSSELTGIQLVLKTGTDDGREEEVTITETDNGVASGSIIRNVNLIEGRNIVKVKFDDNLKHTLKLTAYEAQ